MKPSHMFHLPNRFSREGSAIIAVLGVLVLLSLLFVALLQSARIERSRSSLCSAAEQAHLSVESGVASACDLLLLTTSNRPAYLVGYPRDEASQGVAPVIAIGASNLTNSSQMAPLFSFDLARITAFPDISKSEFSSLLKERLSTNPSEVVDLNDPELTAKHNSTDQAGIPGGGIIAAEGRYPALWQYLRDGEGKLLGRYAFILTDESARLNPLLYKGKPRTDPTDWDNGADDIPMTNTAGTLFTSNEVTEMRRVAEKLPTEGSLETAFNNTADYEEKRSMLTRDPCKSPDLIPASLPEGGCPKYNLNDLATNSLWGKTPYDRALRIAAIIDRDLPKFRERDASLSYNEKGDGLDRSLYTRRLACSIVDYISSEPGPTGPAGGEPAGRDLVPYVTQIAERCTRTSLTSTSTTIESRFFVELWNPTTKTITQGGVPELVIRNRARVKFGDGIENAFNDYKETGTALPELRPNEFIVVAFSPESQSWFSSQTTNFPSWTKGPTGNSNDTHQSFEFYWNGRLADRSRQARLPSGNDAGGLDHDSQTLQDSNAHWQCFTIPTWSSDSPRQEDADEPLGNTDYMFSGDPGANYLTSLIWGCKTDYKAETLWDGIKPKNLKHGWFAMDPGMSWTKRDRIPINPAAGGAPSSLKQLPDDISSQHYSERDGNTAPFVMRKGPMSSLVELGHIFDPAQVDDDGEAPLVGAKGSESHFGCGGSRTLRVGQPEFVYAGTNNWNVPGKRAVELLDLFTLKDEGRLPDTNMVSTNGGIGGRINVNTASHPVLTALFNGITVTSDARFTNSIIGSKSADKLATVLEQNRPYDRLSDLALLATNFVNAETYTPQLSRNVPGSDPPVADVFDRAREEAFGKFIGHCILQTRVFRLFVIGESLDNHKKAIGRALMEGLIHLEPDKTGRLIPSLHDVQWR